MAGKAKNPKAKAKKSKLKKEILDVLRDRCKEMELKISRYTSERAFHENERLKIRRAQTSAEADAEALLNAVRVLSAEVPSDKAAGRKSREDARKLLESRKIRPPHTLGVSRRRKSRKSAS